MKFWKNDLFELIQLLNKLTYAPNYRTIHKLRVLDFLSESIRKRRLEVHADDL